MARKVVHVKPRGEGNWAVQSQGSQRAAGVFENKPDAIQKAKSIAKSASLGQVKIHKQDGRLQTEYTYGKDPKRYPG